MRDCAFYLFNTVALTVPSLSDQLVTQSEKHLKPTCTHWHLCNAFKKMVSMNNAARFWFFFCLFGALKLLSCEFVKHIVVLVLQEIIEIIF